MANKTGNNTRGNQYKKIECLSELLVNEIIEVAAKVEVQKGRTDKRMIPHVLKLMGAMNALLKRIDPDLFKRLKEGKKNGE